MKKLKKITYKKLKNSNITIKVIMKKVNQR